MALLRIVKQRYPHISMRILFVFMLLGNWWTGYMSVVAQGFLLMLLWWWDAGLIDGHSDQL
jgi:hypothetical protein